MTRTIHYIWIVLPAAGCLFSPESSDSAGASESTAASSTDSGALATTTVLTTSNESTSTGMVESTDAESAPTTAGTGTGTPESVCGDGLVEDSEECDDGDDADDDACTNACKLATCGDGIVGPGEACDDGNDDEVDCTSTCALPTCGDGIVQAPEACDAGGETAECNGNCTQSMCGDGTPNTSAGESCDPGGETAECDTDCSEPACGDGVLNVSAGEECDDADLEPGDTCSKTCQETVIVDMALGISHACVLFASGDLRCWGSNEDGELGQGHTMDLGDDPGELPVADIALEEPAIQVSAGSYHTCVVLESQDVRCWGWNGAGQLGNGGYQPLSAPPDVDADVGAKVVEIAGGHFHTCVVTTQGKVRCWGEAMDGQLGYGDEVALLQPNKMDVPTVVGVEQVVLGRRSSYAVTDDGTVRSWGANNVGQLGTLTPANWGDDDPPGTAIVLTVPAVRLSVGAEHVCALTAGGEVHCWGHGGSGRLGNGVFANIGDTMGDTITPVVLENGEKATAIATGELHTCALVDSGVVRCWGHNMLGELGTASTQDIDMISELPAPAAELGGPAKRIWAHYGAFTCAQLEDDSLRCWGYNDHGQLGYGHVNTIGDDETPASAGPVPY